MGKAATIHQKGNDKEKARYYMKPHFLNMPGHEHIDKHFEIANFYL